MVSPSAASLSRIFGNALAAAIAVGTAALRVAPKKRLTTYRVALIRVPKILHNGLDRNAQPGASVIPSEGVHQKVCVHPEFAWVASRVLTAQLCPITLEAR